MGSALEGGWNQCAIHDRGIATSKLIFTDSFSYIDGLIQTAVSPLLTCWRYCSFALSHRYVNGGWQCPLSWSYGNQRYHCYDKSSLFHLLHAMLLHPSMAIATYPFWNANLRHRERTCVWVNISTSHQHQFCMYTSMAECKTIVFLLLTHWRYCSLALSHRYTCTIKCRYNAVQYYSKIWHK